MEEEFNLADPAMWEDYSRGLGKGEGEERNPPGEIVPESRHPRLNENQWMILKSGGLIIAGVGVLIGTTYAPEIASYIETTVDSASLTFRQSPDTLARFIHNAPGWLVRTEMGYLKNAWRFAFGGREQETWGNLWRGCLGVGGLGGAIAAAAGLKMRSSTPKER